VSPAADTPQRVPQRPSERAPFVAWQATFLFSAEPCEQDCKPQIRPHGEPLSCHARLQSHRTSGPRPVQVQSDLRKNGRPRQDLHSFFQAIHRAAEGALRTGSRFNLSEAVQNGPISIGAGHRRKAQITAHENDDSGLLRRPQLRGPLGARTDRWALLSICVFSYGLYVSIRLVRGQALGPGSIRDDLRIVQTGFNPLGARTGRWA
jgi:hypothetical protein